MVGEAGIEPTTLSLEGLSSIQWSYSPTVVIVASGEAWSKMTNKSPRPKGLLSQEVYSPEFVRLAPFQETEGWGTTFCSSHSSQKKA